MLLPPQTPMLQRCASPFCNTLNFCRLTSLNIAIVLTFLSHGLIFLMYGHGGEFMVYFELNFSKDVFSSNIGGGEYENSLPLSSFLSLLGHLFLLAGLLIKTTTSKIYVIWTALILMTASIVNILIHSSNFIAMMVILGSLPYLLSSIWLLKTSIKSYKQQMVLKEES